MPISYMGTKRHLAGQVREALEVDARGPVLDLFGGMGAVPEAIASELPVICNDQLAFVAAINAARFGRVRSLSPERLQQQLLGDFRAQRDWLRSRFSRRLAMEANVMQGGRETLAKWMQSSPNAANSRRYHRMAQDAARAQGRERYVLASTYYASGYFSTSQAIDLDSLRFAIDQLPAVSRGPALAAWLVCASRLANAPGHTAQHLRPNSKGAHRRLLATFRRSAWRTFVESLYDTQPHGTADWRRSNEVTHYDALHLLKTRSRPVGAIYADPPYTRDQYGRFYHVQETLCLYDFPKIAGRGRGPVQIRQRSSFSRASMVEESFREFFRLARRFECPVVLSYPSSGLLSTRGVSVSEVAGPYFDVVQRRDISHDHSTLGASRGAARNAVVERIYRLHPI